MRQAMFHDRKCNETQGKNEKVQIQEKHETQIIAENDRKAAKGQTEKKHVPISCDAGGIITVKISPQNKRLLQTATKSCRELVKIHVV